MNKDKEPTELEFAYEDLRRAQERIAELEQGLIATGEARDVFEAQLNQAQERIAQLEEFVEYCTHWDNDRFALRARKLLEKGTK